MGQTEAEFFSETPEQATTRIISESAPFAAARIAALAQDQSVSPTVQLNAAKYIIDRVLGPVGKDDKEPDALEAFLAEVTGYANGGGK